MKHIILGLLLSVLMLSCKDEEERIPAYIRLEPFAVDALGGEGWQKITEGWVYANNTFLGGFSLPATIPVLEEGEVDILVFPGVKENGLAQTPGVYPFLDRYEATVSLSPAQTTVVRPETKYAANAVFPWSEDRATFNVSTIVLENRDADTATAFVLTTENAFEGRSVRMQVDTAHRLMEIATEAVENLPSTGEKPVWLEMHYRNDIPFELWLLGTQGSGSSEVTQPVYQFAPSENWNKIYFNLTEFLIASQQSKYRLFFRVQLPSGGGSGSDPTSGDVYLDNLRIVHF